MSGDMKDRVGDVLAIDPGERCGWAVFDYRVKLLDSGVIHGDDLNSIKWILEHYDPDTVVIEDQYFPKANQKKAASPKGLVTLFRRRFTWEVTARLLSKTVVIVHPSTWQAHFKISRRAYPDSDTFKSAMIGYAQTFKAGEVEPDECDAILMAAWQAMKG